MNRSIHHSTFIGTPAPSLTPRDDTKKKISEILKRVDNLIKNRMLEQAMHEVARAKEIDPKNVYVHAYEERISSLLEEAQRVKNEELKHRAEEQERAEMLKHQQELDAQKRSAEEQRRHQDEVNRIARLEEKPQSLEQKSKAEPQPMKPEGQSAPEERSPENPTLIHHAEALATYKKFLTEVWADGAPDRNEEIRLLNLRTSLSISLEEHAVLQTQVKRTMYEARLRRAWMSGLITSETSPLLTEYRARFRISPEEHAEIQKRVMAHLHTAQHRPLIMVIDDDVKMLDFLAETLSAEGFVVHAFATTDDAFKALETTKPDLILCDINLETSTMGGFTFYEKLQENQDLEDVPFIFVSGLTDEALIRTGKELGVDDYITKPFSEQTLIATIRGKLHRYRRLQRLRAAS
jgi:CheY-like chemotaxis protein